MVLPIPVPPLRVWRIAGWLCGLAPLAWLGLLTLRGQLGANPVETLEHYTGGWALRLLLLSLAMTPLQTLLRRPEPVAIRRLIGLWAYTYASLHVSIYLVFDLNLSPAQLTEDLVERAYITLGFSAWLLMLPLAITSTRAWQRRLQRRWKRLHRLIYPAALLATAHFWWLVKSDLREPLIYLAVLVALLVLRLRRRRGRGPAAAGRGAG